MFSSISVPFLSDPFRFGHLLHRRETEVEDRDVLTS